ncbi:MAG: type II CAAX prenyl endopeptidase Rce1 family protein [Nitrososphaeraceae archaeon]
MNPRTWLSKYRRTSIGYLTMMLILYHGIGILIMLVGISITQQLISNYKAPSIPLSIISVLSAGPIEETVFFGIPFYLFGNHFVALAGGVIWAALHVLNTNAINISNLAYANWFFVVPSLFFSLRTWISGKGWFAIITHSVWNAIFFTLGCTFGEASCVKYSVRENFTMGVSSIILSGALLGLSYLLYKRKGDKEQQRLAI